MINFKKLYFILFFAMLTIILGCQNKIDTIKLVQETITEIHKKYYPFTAMTFQDEWEDAVINGNIDLANQRRTNQLNFIQGAIDSVNHKVAEVTAITNKAKLNSKEQDYLNGLIKQQNALTSFEAIHKDMEGLRTEWEQHYPPSDSARHNEALASYLKQMAPVLDSNYQKYKTIMDGFSSLRGMNYTSSDKELKVVKIKFDIVHHTLIQSEFARHLKKMNDTYFPHGADQSKLFSDFTSYHQQCAELMKTGLKAVRAELIAQQKMTYQKR
jgi:hypothetical protein